jgi:hypothetical protein
MGGISNTLRQRLAARSAPQVHPEADMLAAYVEQALPAAERDQIVRHLADCAECREVAALSLPIQPEPSLARTLPVGGRGWLLGLRWAGLAATIVIVAALAIKQPWRDLSSNKFSGANTPFASGKPQQMPGPATVDQMPARGNNTEPSSLTAASSVAPPTMRQESSGLEAKKSYVNVDRFATVERDQGKNTDDASALPPPPSPQPASGVNLQSVFVTGSLNRSTSQPDLLADLKAGDPGAGLQSSATSSAAKSSFVSRLHLLKTGKKIIKPVLSAGGLSGHTMGGEGAFSLSLSKSDSTAPALGRLTTPAEKDKVAAAGPDAGAINLKDSSAAFTERARAPATSTAAAPAAAGAYSYEAAPVQWKAADGKLLKSTASFDWQEGYPLHNVAFTTVTHHGNDVWAGGAHAALVHSRNGGADWEKVNLGDTAAGDITKITIEGAKITVKTSTQQTWSSQDGGRSWAQATPN